jgi:colanic acid/amylovoran biosynthesis glycosyltransferase
MSEPERQPRVAFVTGDFLSPSVTFILSQVTGLIDRGFDVEVFCGPPTQTNVVHEDIIRYDLLEKTHCWPRRAGTALAHALKALPSLRRSGQSITPILRALTRPRGSLSVAALDAGRAATFLAEGSFDVIVAHFGNHGISAESLREIGVTSAHLAVFFHGADLTRYLYQAGRDVYDHLFERGDLMVPISERWRGRLIELGCPEDKIRVHRMGVDCSKIKYSERRPDGKVRILSATRLTEKKGLTYALQAMAKLKAQGRTFQYDIVGHGPLHAELKNQVRSLGVEREVTLHGWKTQADLFRLQESAHVALMPSVTAKDGDEEGIPVALMEASASGLAVVSTRHSGIPELVRDGESGYLVPEREAGALADALARLLDAPERILEFGSTGRRIVEEGFEINKLNDELADIIRELAA